MCQVRCCDLPQGPMKGDQEWRIPETPTGPGMTRRTERLGPASRQSLAASTLIKPWSNRPCPEQTVPPCPARPRLPASRTHPETAAPLKSAVAYALRCAVSNLQAALRRMQSDRELRGCPESQSMLAVIFTRNWGNTHRTDTGEDAAQEQSSNASRGW